ncbi:MAG: hypothetical protein WCF65_02135 [Parachlamydiaceae bacterium]
MEELSGIIRDREIYVDNPSFYPLAFTFACEQRKLVYAKDGDNFKRVFVEEYDTLSRRLDLTKFQESCQVRNVLRTRRLANLLINDKGELNRVVIPRLIELAKQHLYSLGPDRQFDAKRQEHVLRVLKLINDNKEVVRLLNSIDKPVSHRYAEQIIRDTLQLSPNTIVTTAHARRAVLSAWMCTLRQNVGSCFGTAPSIIIHTEQPEMFLKDINELLNTGRIKRTFGGIEYSVPLCSSWGGGDLKKPFMIPLGEEFDKSGIWLSPGLTAAFESLGLVDSEAASESKAVRVKGLILTVLGGVERKQPYVITSAEEIIRRVFLNHLNLTQQDIEEYENRPQAMVFGGLLIQGAAGGTGSGGKGGRCADFLARFDTACNALKGLADNALLKAWEFSIASLSETKSQFTRWNLYSSLGLGPQDAGGIGACLHENISRKLERANQRVAELQQEYESLYVQLKTLESRMRSVSSEQEAQWVKVEYQSKRNEFFTFEEMRDKVHRRAENLAELFNVLISHYDNLFPVYFQEVYDPDMHDVSAGPYDDSPAGFRLLYKHGRSNTSQWTYIRTPNEFVDALASFFTATEREITSEDGLDSLEAEIIEITTAIVSHVRTKEFLETAFYRMAVAHNTAPIKDPLEHLDRIDKKPWAYTSGGTMGTLVSCYYKLEMPPSETGRWVESPTELFVFLTDTLKRIPPKLIEGYRNGGDRSMLIHSPTHAFLLKPGMPLFKSAWTNDAFSYTWIRDNLIDPRKRAVEKMEMDEEKMHFLVQRLAKSVPDNYRHYFLRAFGNLYGSMSPKEFRNHIVRGLGSDKGLKESGRSVLSPDEIDSLLYTSLPLFSKSELRERVENLYAAMPTIPPETRKKLMEVFDYVSSRYHQETVIDAATLQDIAKGVLCLSLEVTTSDVDYHMIIAAAAQNLGYALPLPIVFADTNWVKEEFVFVVNPGSGNLELWRGDQTGRVGFPMSSWEEWLNGSRKDRTWGIYDKPYQYQA